MFAVVASIEETAERYSIPKAFIGMILLPIVVSSSINPFQTYALIHSLQQANAAEHVTSIWMAMKGKMELTIGICVGSSIVSITPFVFVSRFPVLMGMLITHSKSPRSSFHFWS
jgi:Ca2+:H+ antiporter